MLYAFRKTLEPYLIIKRDRLNVVFEFYQRIKVYNRKPIEGEELVAREEIYQRFRKVNARGKKQ